MSAEIYPISCIGFALSLKHEKYSCKHIIATTVKTISITNSFPNIKTAAINGKPSNADVHLCIFKIFPSFYFAPNLLFLF